MIYEIDIPAGTKIFKMIDKLPVQFAVSDMQKEIANRQGDAALGTTCMSVMPGTAPPLLDEKGG